MNEKEALTRIKTGNFGNDYGFDMQLLVDAVGTIGEKLKRGQITEVVRCKDCKYGIKALESSFMLCIKPYSGSPLHDINYYCADGERKDDDE